MNRHDIAIAIKKVLFSKGEKYTFNNKELLFTPGTRPVRRKYINAESDVVRNDVLQIFYFEKHFKPQHVLWDIGAHHGHYSLFAASVAQGANQVFSFEPDKSARQVQMKNIQLNRLQNKITVSDIAVSDHDGTLHFHDMHGNANSHIVKGGGASTGNTVEVRTKTLDTLAAELPMPDFVKIDTEGAEIDILSAAGKLLQQKNIRFICELHPFAWDQFKVKYEDFSAILKKYDRTLTLLDDRKQVKDLPYYGTVLF